MRKNTYIIGTKNGFTLVELLVAMFLFSTLMVLVGSMFVQGLNLQRRAFNIQQTEENGTFLMESLLKELRVADVTAPVTDSNCPSSPDSVLSVTHPDFGALTYRLVGTDIQRNGVVMNSNGVEFTKFVFCVSGMAEGDGKQTRITILASARSQKTKQQSYIDIQTTISPRTIND